MSQKANPAKKSRPLLLKNKSGVSLIELLIAIAILGVLSAVAISFYHRYKNSVFKIAMKMELVQIAKHLNNAFSIDGGYHQKIFTAGYRPNYELYNDAGFDYARTDAICCSDYTSPLTEYFTLTGNVGDAQHEDSAVKAGQICDSNTGLCRKNNDRWAEFTTGTGAYSGSAGNAKCSVFTSKAAQCSCTEYIIQAVVRISAASSDLSRMFLNQAGLMCDEGSSQWEAGDHPLELVE